MKKFLATLLLVAILVSSIAASAALLKFTKNAYLYEKPRCHKTSTVIKKGSIAEGTPSAKMTKGHFSAVKIQGKTFYVKSELLKVVTSGTPKIIYAQGGTGKSNQPGTPEKVTGFTRVYVVKGKKVNVRATPSLAGKAVGASLKGGKWVKFLGYKAADERGVYFYKIQDSKGRIGWVSEVYTYLK